MSNYQELARKYLKVISSKSISSFGVKVLASEIINSHGAKAAKIIVEHIKDLINGDALLKAADNSELLDLIDQLLSEILGESDD